MFFDTGRVDKSLYTHNSVDFTPSFSHGAIATIVVGVMLGLAVLTLLSLPWMAWRVRKRGRIGRKSSAVLRSLYPIMLGLGGWFIGVLIVLTTMPGVALDDELLATISVGLPIALGVYSAWVHRDWSTRRESTGFALAIGGGLAGAWLGFHATVDLLALLTAIVGAGAGANLTVILHDIARDRRPRSAETASRGMLDARPSTG